MIDTLKGEINKKIIDLTYYGGYNIDGILEIIEGDYSSKAYLPEKDDVFIFTANKTVITKNTSRNITDSFIVYNPHQADLLNEYIINEDASGQNSITQSIISNYYNELYPIQPLSLDNCLLVPCDDPGGGNPGGGSPGESFNTAIFLSLGQTYSTSISGNQSIYFKSSQSTIKDLILISSTTANIDLEVRVYHSENNLMYSSSIDMGFQDVDRFDNFKAYALVSPATYGTAYFEIYLKDTSKSGSFSVSLTNRSNPDTCRNDEAKLTSAYYNSPYVPAVFQDTSGDNIIVYQDITDMDYGNIFSDAADAWNLSSGDVHIYNLEQKPTIPHSLEIREYYDPNTTDKANYDYDVANPDSKFISYNEFYFGGFTSDEKLRTIIHEFGHALGLFEFNKFNSDGTTIPESKLTVMRQGVRSFPLSPSTCDIDVLTYIWGE